MTSCCSSEEEDGGFFDAREEITSVSDLSAECPEYFDFSSRIEDVDLVSSYHFAYDVWINSPVSVHERRCQFFELMGIGRDWTSRGDPNYLPVEEFPVEIDRIVLNSEAELGNSDFKDRFSSSESCRPCCSNVACDVSEDEVLDENLACRIRNLDDGTEFVVDQLGEDGMLSRLRVVGSNRSVTVEEFNRIVGLSPLVQQIMQREARAVNNSLEEVTRSVRKKWLKRLGTVGCIVDRERDHGNLNLEYPKQTLGVRTERIRVRPCKKRCKELSALYIGQDIKAHEGAILTMKFSPNGQYLASAGEDGVVRVWQVLENDRSNEGDIPDADPSCIYFMANHSSELTPLFKGNEKIGKTKSSRKASELACVILPPKVFHLSEKPLHEFHGHRDDILDLSWSRNKYLLSSSVDKSVRLWQVGCDQCLKVFYHNDFVTCVQFNPVDEDYFISGSIDGKVRIWAISGCHVVDWMDIREIVTAISYRPDGQGGIVGSMTGSCYFYEASDNNLQLGAHICIQGKKKYPGRKITGFQFSPSDPNKLMVTSADSQIRILEGIDVICKYRGFRNTGSQISASFTSDGTHIVSASEDSSVYIWNYSNPSGPSTSQVKSIWSYERFFSNNVSVAIPWPGVKSGDYDVSVLSGNIPFQQHNMNPPRPNTESGWQHWHLDKNRRRTLPLPSPEFLSLSCVSSFDGFPKGSATWPEENLRSSSSPDTSPSTGKSQYKFFKTSCQSMYGCPHAWGQVILTAGWDGRIRSFHNYGLPIRS